MRKGKIEHTWFRGGRTSICYNALDRHVNEGRGDVPCFLWEGNQPTDTRSMTYKQVLDEVCRVVRTPSSLMFTTYDLGKGKTYVALPGLAAKLLHVQANWLKSTGVKKGDAVAMYASKPL